MLNIYEEKYIKELKIDCKKCFGLCCVALYFSTSDGFPTDKEAGKPCMNLKPDFTCSVHKDLRKKGLKGCTAYDCFGAGQKVSQITYKGYDWQQIPASANQMFSSFLIMRQLHEMLWYLTQAVILQKNSMIREEIGVLLDDTAYLTTLDVDSLLALDITSHRTKVNHLLKKTCEMVHAEISSRKRAAKRNQNRNFRLLDYFGCDLRKVNLVGADLAGACLIATNLKGVDLTGANFIGADLRDADVRGANLEKSIFLTQAQINTAKGDTHTKLPHLIDRPCFWSE